jgi:predicted transcriptional regulator
MTDEGRVVTTNVPGELASRMDEVAGRIDRSKSWIVREAVTQWLVEEERRFELSMESLGGGSSLPSHRL